MLDMTLWWGSIRRETLQAHLSAWQMLASVPRIQKCLWFQTHLRSYLHSCSAGESLRNYHSLFVVSITVAFLKSIQVFLCFDVVDSTPLHLLIEMIESNKDIGHVRQNENELRILEAICMTMLVLSQKQGYFHKYGKNTIQHLSPG